MDIETARRLTAMTNDFYRENAASFSATRSRPWEGWERCLDDFAEVFYGQGNVSTAERKPISEHASDILASGDGECTSRRSRVLDLACGNLRFERHTAQYLAERNLPEPEFLVVDSCEPLVESGASMQGVDVEFHVLDITEALLADTIATDLGASPCNLAVCFGFLHHVPGFENRVRLLKAMAGSLAPGGIMAVSLWRFMDDPRIAAKARNITAHWATEHPEAQLDENDCLLGWQDRTDTLRYCHHFTDKEIDGLVEAVADQVTLLDRFNADGKSGEMNAYIVLRKNR